MDGGSWHVQEVVIKTIPKKEMQKAEWLYEKAFKIAEK